MSDDTHGMTEFDQGLFQHEGGPQYFHLFREVLLTYRAFLRRMAAETGVSGAQFELLRVLALRDGRSGTLELARELDVDPAAVTRLVAALRERGLVDREDDACDKRRRPVVLTPAGREYMTQLHTKLHAREGALEASLDPADIETASEVLRTIRSVLDPGARGRRV
jgi:MarR family transcriptional regulator, transcriptional regulator for hemolysin